MELRNATLADADLLLAWRNDPRTRAASHRQEVVERERHLRWLTDALARSDLRLFVAEENGVPVGTVRVVDETGVAELSWTVAPEARGRGVGTRMVARLAERERGALRAEVRAGNVASMRIAEAAGLALDHEENGVLHYRRDALDAETAPEENGT